MEIEDFIDHVPNHMQTGYEEWEEWREKHAYKLRGIEWIDYNNSLTLVRADIDEVGQVFAKKAAFWQKNVGNQEIRIDGEFFLCFQIPGNAWTQIMHSVDGGMFRHKTILKEDWPCIVSRCLDTRVITYECSDTIGYIGYTLYTSGELLEKLESTAGDWTSEDWERAHQLFIEEEAYEPGISFNNLLDIPYPPLRGEKVMNQCRVQPIVERVDYIRLTD